MNKTLVITVLATDRPGIVHTISEALVAHNANWIDSRMANLADKFAGLLQISVPPGELQALEKRLQDLHDSDNQIQIMMEAANEVDTGKMFTDLSLEVTRADRPGIIGEITGALAQLNVNIKELETEIREASMSAELLFWAKLDLGLPEGVSKEDVQDALEALSDQLMVDIVFSD